MAHFYPQGLLLLVLLVVISECKADSPMIDTVSASQEEDAFLPFFNSTVMTLESCYRVRLVKYATDASQMNIVILEWPKKLSNAKRVQWKHDWNGQMSLHLTKVQKSDEGLYSCEVYQGWDCTLVKNISLKVKDCKISLAVKTASSTDITLKCPVEITSGQQGPRNISWAVLKGGNPMSVNFKRVVINDTSLVINSVNTSDSGWYRCQYMFGQTQRCFDINLLIQENVVQTTIVPGIRTTTTQQGKKSQTIKKQDSTQPFLGVLTDHMLTTSKTVQTNKMEESSGAFIAVVASVIIGIVIIAALLGLYIYRRCNTVRIIQQTQNLPAGAVRQSDCYEDVSLTASDNPSNQRLNSLYQQFEDDCMLTFR